MKQSDALQQLGSLNEQQQQQHDIIIIEKEVMYGNLQDELSSLRQQMKEQSEKTHQLTSENEQQQQENNRLLTVSMVVMNEVGYMSYSFIISSMESLYVSHHSSCSISSSM